MSFSRQFPHSQPIFLATLLYFVATDVWPLSPATLTSPGGVSPDNISFAAGATLFDPLLKGYFALDSAVDASAPCVKGSFDLYTVNGAGYVLTCTAGPIFGAVAGKNIVIVKETVNGTAAGIHQTAIREPEAGFPKIIDHANWLPDPAFFANCSAPVLVPSVAPYVSYNSYTCTEPLHDTVVPNVSLSEEDPTLWSGIYPVTSKDAQEFQKLRSKTQSVFQTPYALVVSKPLRDLLQQAEGLLQNSETSKDVPSLTSAQVRAILSGQLTVWENLWVWNETSKKEVQVVTTGFTPVHICRRADSSGVQVAANAHFFSRGCLTWNGGGSIVTSDNPSAQFAGETWTASSAQINAFSFAAATSQDLVKCVAAGASSSDTRYRIGFVSTNVNPFNLGFQLPPGSSDIRYIRLDEQVPSIWAIQKGQYRWFMEPTIQYTCCNLPPSPFIPSLPASLRQNFPNYALGNRKLIWDTLIRYLGNANVLAALNQSSQQSTFLFNDIAPNHIAASDSGFLTLGNHQISFPPGPSTPDWPGAIRAIGVAGKGPNSNLSKTFPGQPVNNCNPAFQINPGQ